MKKSNKYCKQHCHDPSVETHGTWCRQDGTCQQCPKVKCTVPTLPDGCPNQLQVAFKFLAKVNEIAYLKGGKSFFKIIIVDKEKCWW